MLIEDLRAAALGKALPLCGLPLRKQSTLPNVQEHKGFEVSLCPRGLRGTRHMRPPRSWQIPLVLLLVAYCCAAQRNSELRPTETMPLEYNLQLWGAPQLQCDSDGNLYMLAHFAQDSSRDHLLRVSADATETTQIDLRSVPELQGFRILPVFATGRGGEFLLVALKNPSEGTNEQQSDDEGNAGKGHSAEVYVATFDRGGNFISNAKLDVPVEPKAI